MMNNPFRRAITIQQVISNLNCDILTLFTYLLNCEDGTTKIFREKAAMLAEKCEEREKFELLNLNQ